VLIAYAWPSVRDGLVLLLADRRPALVVAAVIPAALDTVLPAALAPVVICRVPTACVRRYARGWIALYPDDPPTAVVGTGGQWQVHPLGAVDDLLSALDEVLTLPPPGWTEHGDTPAVPEMRSDQWKKADMEGRREFYLVTAVLLLLLLLVNRWPS
jgi:hypothetical protein